MYSSVKELTESICKGAAKLGRGLNWTSVWQKLVLVVASSSSSSLVIFQSSLGELLSSSYPPYLSLYIKETDRLCNPLKHYDLLKTLSFGLMQGWQDGWAIMLLRKIKSGILLHHYFIAITHWWFLLYFRWIIFSWFFLNLFISQPAFCAFMFNLALA